MSRCAAAGACALATGLLLAGSAAAQPPADPPPPLAIESRLPADVVDDLPTAGNLAGLIETTQAAIIGDRFDVGGLNTGVPARLGAFLGSWTQTAYRIGDVDVTDPDGSGSPLFYPEIVPWRRIDVRTGLMPIDVNAPAIVVSLDPRAPAAAWTGRAEGTASGPALAADRSSDQAPSIARLNRWGRGAAVASGPVVPGRIGLGVGAAWTSASQFERAGPTAADDSVGSAFAHLVVTATPADRLRTFALVQRARYPSGDRVGYQQPLSPERDLSAHVQSLFEHAPAGATAWRAFAAYTRRARTPDPLAGPLTVERLQDGPVPLVLGDAATTDHRWSIGARVTPAAGALNGRLHAAEFGVDVGGAGMRTPTPFAGDVTESIDGAPARLWRYTAPGLVSSRHDTTVAVFAGDRFDLLPRVSLEAGLRYDGVEASADGAASGISWHTWLPRAVLRWSVTDLARIAAFAGYRRTAYRPALDLLAWGDPAAPVGAVYRAGGGTPLVSRVGPGTGGDASFSAIDPDLARPVTDELVLGVESQPTRALRLGLTGFARRERHAIAVVDTGVPITQYALHGIADPGLDFAHTDDDQVLPVYEQLPGSFGQDRYLVTNPSQPAATLAGLQASIAASTDRLFVLFGATASLARATAASRGYHATENDQDLPGELYVDPNAATLARGRPFADRAYTIKLTTVYRFAHEIRAGVVARYQDGQPFARMVVAPGLAQGAEAIRAIANGDSRFTYTGTLDLRLQKGLTVAGRRLDLIADAFNLVNLGNEVEERVVTGAAFRTITAVQPPRAVHLGARISF